MGVVLGILVVVGVEGACCVLVVLCVCYDFVCDIHFLRCLVQCVLSKYLGIGGGMGFYKRMFWLGLMRVFIYFCGWTIVVFKFIIRH